MADRELTIHVPEHLLHDVESAQIDVQSIVVEALRSALTQNTTPVRLKMPSREDIERNIAESLLLQRTAPERQRKLGLHFGQAWVSDDFDDPLPDEFWLGEDT
jgi:hypothetical protein